MTERDKRKAEAIWSYTISVEKILKHLVEQGIQTQEEADYLSNLFYEELNVNDIPGCRCSNIGELMRSDGTIDKEYVSLTEIARSKSGKNPGYLIQCWLRNANTVEYLRMWENKFNSNFLDNECEKLLKSIKSSNKTLTLKLWINATNAKGIKSKAGKNGGSIAHPEIAEVFRAWLFPEIMLEMVQCYQNLGGDAL